MLGSHRSTAKKESLAPSSRSSASETAKIQEEKRKGPQETGQAGAETSSPYPSFGRSASPHSIRSSSASSSIPPKVIFQSPALGEASKRTDDFYASAFHKLGTKAHEAGQRDRAVHHFQEALRSNPRPELRDKVQNDLDALFSRWPELRFLQNDLESHAFLNGDKHFAFGPVLEAKGVRPSSTAS